VPLDFFTFLRFCPQWSHFNFTAQSRRTSEIGTRQYTCAIALKEFMISRQQEYKDPLMGHLNTRFAFAR
jgi:hypothetical protein